MGAAARTAGGAVVGVVVGVVVEVVVVVLVVLVVEVVLVVLVVLVVEEVVLVVVVVGTCTSEADASRAMPGGETAACAPRVPPVAKIVTDTNPSIHIQRRGLQRG